jgi:hypothetical protein
MKSFVDGLGNCLSGTMGSDSDRKKKLWIIQKKKLIIIIPKLGTFHSSAPHGWIEAQKKYIHTHTHINPKELAKNVRFV